MRTPARLAMLARREFLTGLTAAGTAAWMAREPRLLHAESVVHPRPRADACIVLWMAGGMAAPDTFDPKKYVPFEPGVKVADV